MYLYRQSSETTTYATVMKEKKHQQNKLVPPEYETLKIKNDSLRDATSATNEKSQEEMMDDVS